MWEETLDEQTVWLMQRRARREPREGAGSGEGTKAAVAAAKAAAPAPAPQGQHQSQRARVASVWDDMHVLLPLGAFADGSSGGGSSGGVPLAEGRRIKGAAWMAPDRLLLVTAPHPEPGYEDGAGDVLVEVSVQLPEPILSYEEDDKAAAAAAEAAAREAPAVEELQRSYAGGTVIHVAPAHPGHSSDGGAGSLGALMQLASGALLRHAPGSGGPQPLGPSVSFPTPCPLMTPLPSVSGSSGAAAAIGLAPNGVLYAGRRAVASGVTSFAVRWGGSGGGAVLYTTRQSLLYVVMLSQLGSYVHREVSRAFLKWMRDG
jgi:hypothetical protein